MVEIFSAVLLIIITCYVIEKKLNIPLPLSLIAMAFLVKLSFPTLINVNSHDFDQLLLLLLPIVLLPDILNLHLDEVKKNWKPIFYFSVISVVVTMLLGAFLAKVFIFDNTMTIAASIALFAILAATDAVSVLNVFGKFELPKKLKIIAEGDSLGNDPIALILFKLIGLSLIAGIHLGASTVIDAVAIFGTSILVGFGIGHLAHLVLKYLEDMEFEFLIIYTAAVGAFVLAEHFHASGILAVILAVALMNFLIEADLKRVDDRIEDVEKLESHQTLLAVIKNKVAVSRSHMDDNRKVTNFIALVANSFIFIFMAFSIDLHSLDLYLKEIVLVFVMLTILRFILSFIVMKAMNKPLSWTIVLTMAGIKGGLSLIMVHSLPDFELKEMLTAIVVGNVILSTYLNTAALMLYLKRDPKF